MANAIAWADEGDQEFESLSLQRRVNKLSVPPKNDARCSTRCHRVHADTGFCILDREGFGRHSEAAIYVRSRRAGERVIASVSRFLTKQLRLNVNEGRGAATAIIAGSSVAIGGETNPL
jgi:hypothetical protein